MFEHLRDVLTVDLSDSPAVDAAFRGILEEQSRDEPGPGSEAMTSALMSQCLVQLFRRLSQEAGEQIPWLSALGDPRLASALDRILEDPAADHTVESLAEAASMSRSAFAERFLSAFNRTPMNLVTQIRMQRAAHMLEQNTSLSIDEVAEKVGYSGRSHFSRAFKQHFEVTPAEFRSR
jgi:transcriptional regulator GlxA family with amidase domain